MAAGGKNHMPEKRRDENSGGVMLGDAPRRVPGEIFVW